jgi:hypothetical protein
VKASALFLLALAACSGQVAPQGPLTAGEVHAEIGAILCAKIRDCFPDGGITATYGSFDGCVAKTFTVAPERLGDPGTCTRDELAACRTSVSRQACDASPTATSLPPPCLCVEANGR